MSVYVDSNWSDREPPAREYRRLRGMTQVQLCVAAGISLATLAVAERGGPLSEKVAKKLARALKTDSDALRRTEWRRK